MFNFLYYFSRVAHGKRSYMPQREENQETKTGELSDRWSLFKIVPERVNFFSRWIANLYKSDTFQNDIYRLKGIYPGNTQFAGNAM